MSTRSPSSEPFNVVIAGGSVAALEAALALGDLAGYRIRTTLIAPNAEFVYRPMTVREPFAYGIAQRYPLSEVAADIGAKLVTDSLTIVDARKRVVHTAAKIHYPYDALILALGARSRACYAHALTLDDARLDELMHALIEDVEAGYVGRLAFVIPGRMTWPLPIYELALMTAARAYEMSIELQSTIVTPEDAPLAIFGRGASDGISQLLKERSITTVTSAHCEIPESGRIVIAPGDRRLEVDRIVALPELYGPAVPGVPRAHQGFIPVDPHCKVRGVERVYAAGDGTDFAIKHGGIASQQADAAAQAIAALAGVQIRPEPFRPLIRGMLLTGSKPKYLSAHLTGGHSFNSKITDEPMWSPSTKIAARYLAPYLETRGSGAQRA